MEIILKEKIRNLGELGQVVKVKAGYARNYLVPKGRAVQATKVNLQAFEAERAELEKVAAAKLKAAQAVADKLEGQEIKIEAKAGDAGKLFGSLGTRDLAKEVSKLGVEVQKSQVRLPEGVIRETGEFEVIVHLHTDIDINVKVNVVAAK